MSRTSRSDAEVTLISSENFILFTPMPFRPEGEKRVIELLRSIWRHGESTAGINSKAVPGNPTRAPWPRSDRTISTLTIKRGIARKAMLEERP
jgi:hypothetical protein